MTRLVALAALLLAADAAAETGGAPAAIPAAPAEAAVEEEAAPAAGEPGAWMAAAQEAIYARSSYLLVTWESFDLVGDALSAGAIGVGGGQSERVAPGTRMWGLSAEYGSMGRHFGLLTIGASYFQSTNDFELELAPSGREAVRSRLYGGSLRLLQPQLRLAVWRFALGAQAGFVGRAAHVETVAGSAYKRGFLLADVGVELQGGLQFYLVDGLFLQGAWRQSFTLTGSTDGTREIRAGVGYAF